MNGPYVNTEPCCEWENMYADDDDHIICPKICTCICHVLEED